MRAFTFVLAAVATCWPVAADALTIRDVVELTRAGLGEDTLLALIEVDPSVFPIDAATLKTLKAAGVSERVIIAMIRSGRSAASEAVVDPVPLNEPLAQAAGPQVVVIDHRDAAPRIQEVHVPVPIYIPIVEHHDHDDRRGSDGTDRSRPKEKTPDPVYWGFGGKLRPDAWQPR